MSLILYINGQQADLEPGTVIAQTRQVNDLNSLENRQASYTNKFSLPKTAHNIRLLDFLTLAGNDSNIPYQKNECSLYSASGECFVYKGWAVITDGGDSYDAVVYDGIIDLYKTIENKTLADLTLTAINHIKDPATVVASWAGTTPYRYILADYNGDNHVASLGNTLLVNIESLMPAVQVKWLWDAVFNTFNNDTPATGSIFNSDDFTNLWLTFPKGISHTEEQETELFLCNGITLSGTSWRDYSSYYLPLPEANIETITDVNVVNGRHIKVSKSGNYRIELVDSTVKVNKPIALYAGINAQDIPVPGDITNRVVLMYKPENETEFNAAKNVVLSAGDTVCIFFDNTGNDFDFTATGNTLNVRLVRLEDSVIDFTTAFADFSIRDFLNEIVYRFGLTIFKDKYSDAYTFLTLEELLLNAPKADWSKKFISKESENYLTGSYARRNWFTYTYNDKDVSYNDGYIDIANEQLPETKTLIKSKIYSPEQQPGIYAGVPVNVYKMWEKEVSEEEADNPDGTTTTTLVTKYKPLDKRFYLMRCFRGAQYFRANSSVLPQPTATAQLPWFATFSGLSFKDTLQKYYAPLSRITDKSRVLTANMWLSEADIANFDFKKLYHIEQLSSNFLVNKISNYVPGKPVKCELLRVLPQNYGQLPFYITHIEAVYNSQTGQQQIVAHFITTQPQGLQYILQYEYGDTWVNPDAFGYQSPITLIVPPPLVGQRYRMRLWCEDGSLSNTLYVTLQGNYTVYA